jgi:hypothetical protein
MAQAQKPTLKTDHLPTHSASIAPKLKKTKQDKTTYYNLTICIYKWVNQGRKTHLPIKMI